MEASEAVSPTLHKCLIISGALEGPIAAEKQVGVRVIALLSAFCDYVLPSISQNLSIYRCVVLNHSIPYPLVSCASFLYILPSICLLSRTRLPVCIYDSVAIILVPLLPI